MVNNRSLLRAQVSERTLELAHWCLACDPGAPIKEQHKWVDTASDACAAHQNVWDAMEFFCKSTGHGRFRDSSTLSAAVAALTTAHEDVHPARATFAVSVSRRCHISSNSDI